jgi:hypothetical protein
MINFIIYLLILLGFAGLALENIKLRNKYRTSVVALFQAYVDKNISDDIAKKSLEEKVIIENTSKESQEGFINFLNQSRDWAFRYIENTQAVVNKFVNDVEPDFIYFDKYGDPLGGKPNYDALKRISEAFKELKTVLPEPDKSE